jgi:hypothetical protein
MWRGMQQRASDMDETALMDEFAISEPLILLGRGGSGTRLLSSMAQTSGVFLGNELNSTQDSVEWITDIYDLAFESTSSGIAAASSRDFYWRDRLRKRAAEILAKASLSPDVLWGWKLPETMLALAQVLRTFPRARMVHLVRHPFSIAARRTHVTSRSDNPVGRAVLAAAYRACGLDEKDIPLDPIYLHNATSWNYQVASVLRVLRDAALPERVLLLRYEEICLRGDEAQRRFADFLGIVAPSMHAPSIDWSRIGEVAYERSIADRIWSVCGATASALGYNQDGAGIEAPRGPLAP